MKTTITQEARTGVYTITTQDAELIALLDQGIVEKAPVTMVTPMTYGVISPGVLTPFLVIRWKRFWSIAQWIICD